MKILAVRIGDKYGPEYEDYLEEKLSDYELVWIREPYEKGIALQWNKMYGMQLDIDEPICIMDIDVLLVNDYKKVFEYPVDRGQFVAMPGWWRDTKKEGYSINGGFFKYYPKDCKYIYDKFMSDIGGWQQYYINNGVTNGPVNGEQNFVEESVKEKLELITFSDKWCTRWCQDPRINRRLDSLYLKYFHEPLILSYKNNREFNDKVKMVHFTYSLNKPHESEMFKDLYT